jgi:exonuclease VII small subunit
VAVAFDRAVDELYGLPLDEFVPRRDGLARELRAAGRGEEADRVKGLVKPSAPAWAVNQLAREHPDDVRALLEAGDEVRRVQDWLLRREADPADLRAAVEAERAAVAGLVHTAADILTRAGRAARGDVLERVGETLHAAAADPEVRADVERGRVVRDRAAVGIGSYGAGGTPAAGATRRAGGAGRAPRSRAAKPPREPASEAAPDDLDAEQRRRSEAARQAAREAARAADAEARAAERMRAAADRAVERADRALEAAEASWERAREELRERRDDLAAAEQAAQQARAAAEAAEAAADERRRAAGDD